MQYCSLQHRTLLLSPVTSTTGYCFYFGSIPSFFLVLFLNWSPVAYWAPTDLGSSSLSILSFCLFILFMGFSRQEYWSGLPFPSPVDHILSDLSTADCPEARQSQRTTQKRAGCDGPHRSVAVRSFPSPKVSAPRPSDSDPERQAAIVQERRPRGASPHRRSGAASESSYHMPEARGWWPRGATPPPRSCCRCRRAERGYSE